MTKIRVRTAAFVNVNNGDIQNCVCNLETGKRRMKTVRINNGRILKKRGDTSQRSAQNEKTPSVYKEISDEKQLLRLAQRIALGDRKAAAENYILTKDIDLKGKRIIPIGSKEEYPFEGHFLGNGHWIKNFRVTDSAGGYAGLFGVVGKNGKITDLNVDCMVKSAKEEAHTASVCGKNYGLISRCTSVVHVVFRYTGAGFVYENFGSIKDSCLEGVLGRYISPFVPAAGTAAALLVLALLLWGPLRLLLFPPEEILPVQADINAVKSEEDPSIEAEDSAGRASFELFQEMQVSAGTMTGNPGIKNPSGAEMDFVVTVKISDKELAETIGKTGRSVDDQQKLEDGDGYDPEQNYTVLFESGRILRGYELNEIELGSLEDGTVLPAGSYEMMFVLDFYDPVTNERSMVNAQLPVTVTVQ